VSASNARSATVRRGASPAAVPTPRRSTAPFGERRLPSKYPASHKNSFEALPGLGVPQLMGQFSRAAGSAFAALWLTRLGRLAAVRRWHHGSGVRASQP